MGNASLDGNFPFIPFIPFVSFVPSVPFSLFLLFSLYLYQSILNGVDHKVGGVAAAGLF